jgi:hypothetical protein
MAKTWTLLPPVTPSEELVAVVGGHPLVAHLLAQRNIINGRTLWGESGGVPVGQSDP